MCVPCEIMCIISMFTIIFSDSCEGRSGVQHIWNAPTFEISQSAGHCHVFLCFGLIYGIPYSWDECRTDLQPHLGAHSLQLIRTVWKMWRNVINGPASSGRCVFRFTPPTRSHSSVHGFPEVCTICSGRGGFGEFCQTSNPLMDRRLVY